MRKPTKILAISMLISATAASVPVLGQQSQWVQISTSENGDLVYFDLASQVRVFDAGVKQNTFQTLTLATSAARRSFRQRYHADCFKGTLALRGLELVNTQGTLIRAVPLERADKDPVVPAKDTVAADIWRYACSQF